MELMKKNSFRDEVKTEGKTPIQIETEKVGEAEMKKRDMLVTFLQLSFQKVMHDRDINYLRKTIEVNEDVLDTLAVLPLSNAKELVVMSAQQQIAQASQQINKLLAPNPNDIILDLLVEKFSKDTETIDLLSDAKANINSILHNIIDMAEVKLADRFEVCDELKDDEGSDQIN
jgi:hypothetical protein